VRPASKHFDALDSLRGIAAVVVALFHIQWPNYITQNAFVGHGYLMVDFFFVLSGFVIAFNYITYLQGPRTLGRFAWLRFWRLYPMHILMLFVFLGIELLKYEAQSRFGIVGNEEAFSTDNARSFLLQLLMAHAFFNHSIYSFNNVAWSISLEFYLYFLFALTVLSRRPIFAAVCLVSAAFIVTVLFGTFPLARCIYGFFAGVLAYQVYRMVAARRLRLGSVVPLATLVLAVLIVAEAGALAFILLPWACLALILSLALFPETRVAKILCQRWLVRLGTLSYSIYMVHPAILWCVNQMLRLVTGRLQHGTPINAAIPPLIGSVLVLLFLACVLVVSHLTYYFIEEPWRLWSKRSSWGRVGNVVES
jgi:peptidoglycan/LPS O-acetylase OafA/YrhL